MNDGKIKRVDDKKAVDTVLAKQGVYINKTAYKAVNGKGVAQMKATDGSLSSRKKNSKKSKTVI